MDSAEVALATGGSAADFVAPRGPDLATRVGPLSEWYGVRLRHGTWPYVRTTESAPGPSVVLRDEDGVLAKGFNLASQDYLSLASHPQVVEAAIRAIRDYGVHSAGSAVLMGNTVESRGLQTALGEVLGFEHVLLFPTGWAAGYGVLRALTSPGDVVLIDALAHNCLQEGAVASGASVKRYAHNHLGHLERLLRQIRKNDRAAAIFVVTEGLFSMDADTPDLRAVSELCRGVGATLIVDVAHDFGVLGPTGRSALEEHGVLDHCDLVMGSFSKVFASNGGFVATRDVAILRQLRMFGSTWMFSNALSPAQAATVSAAMAITFGEEGSGRRGDLFAAIHALRNALTHGGLSVLGRPSPIMPVEVGLEADARRAVRKCAELGVVVNLAEYPVVAKGRARFRLQVQADHSPLEAAAAGRAIVEACRSVRAEAAA